ncbi:hypothetical protein M758_1G040300 [Ceratodon purpureus]|nr:hypothetical protein M758_1G040300 [Ceratodon purpureus]
MEQGRRKPTELQKISDPNFLVEVAVGPPLANLVPQRPGTGIVVGGQYCDRETRFVWKKAHLSVDDNRIFDTEGRLMCVSHHYGKNPYDSLDPLDVIPDNPLGDWESICYISGYHGMPDLKVRPKGLSIHGRQRILDASGEVTVCNIARLSRLKSKSIRHNLAVFAGDEEKEPTYSILLDLAGRTIQLVNQNDERIAVFTKSVQTLILNAALGVGSEFAIDVAPGVDYTAVLAICIGLHQVGKHYAKDAFSNFLVQPAQGAAVGFAVDQATQFGDGGIPDVSGFEMPEVPDFEMPDVEVPEDVGSTLEGVINFVVGLFGE